MMGNERILHVENLSRQRVVVRHGRVAATFWARLKGLIGVRNLPAGDGLLIEPCNSIHCFFMSIPIDVIYADREHQVVALERSMRPWSIGRIHRQAHYVLELPVGTLDRTDTAVGDQLAVAVGG